MLDPLKFVDGSARRRAIAERQTRVRQVVRDLLARPLPLDQHPLRAAVVFLHESIHTPGDAKDVKRCQVGSAILDSSVHTRRLILLAALNALRDAPLKAPSWMENVHGYLRFVHDYHLGMLIKAILRSRPAANEDLLEGILKALSRLAGRFNSNYPANSYEFPFALVVRFVDKQMPRRSVDSLAPAVKNLLASLKAAVAHDLVSLKGYRKAESKVLSAHPGRWFTKADRSAMELIESWRAR